MEVTGYLLMFAVVTFLFICYSDGKITSKIHDDLIKENVVHLKNDVGVADHLLRFKREASNKTGKKHNPAAGNNTPPPGFSTPTDLPDKSHNEAVVHWSGENSKAIFVLTREKTRNGTIADSRLWRSKDYGSTFEDRSKKFPSGTIIRYYYVSPLNKYKLLFTDVKKNVIFTTKDEGETITQIPTNFLPNRITFHPKNDNWLLAYSYDDATLYVSHDFAQTWKKVHDRVTRFFWEVEGLDSDISTIHMEILDPVAVTYSYKACVKPYCKDVTHDPALGNIDIHSLIVQDDYIFVQKSPDLSTSQLFVSYKRGPFKQARFPPTLHPLDFNILDSNEGQVFLAVNHQERIVNLYLSNATGQVYTKTLDRVVNLHSSMGMMVDLYEVRGINGTFIANQYVADGMAKTFITFDKGGNWTLIPAPERDNKGKPTNCKLPDCSLHLHLYYSSAKFNIPQILSEDNAPGMIIAHGVLGNQLKVPTANVFISRDGGLTWSELFEGSYIFNILDQGGALVAVDYSIRTPKNDFRCSFDEGSSWSRYNFSSERIIVDGVLNEPGITTLISSIFGHKKNNSGWVIVKLDFTKILTQQCNDKDYYLWTPADQLSGHNCILGQKITFERRKPEAHCANGKNYRRPIKHATCTCIEEDYECDYGYERKNQTCKVSSWYDPTLPPEDCPEDSLYPKTDGYRKVAADQCTGGDVLHRVKWPKCPIVRPGKLSIIPPKKLVLKSNESAHFELVQGMGTKKSTKYTWNFGDGHTKANLRGFDKNAVQNHTYTSGGKYVVNVTATNKKGHNVTNITVEVQDVILALHVVVPHGVQIYHDISFNATVNPGRKHGDIFYSWLFGDETAQDKLLLSWSPNVKHNYTKPGKYSVRVQAFNAVSTVFQKFNIMVYTKVRTVRLSFFENMENANKRTPAWRHQFEVLLKKQLMSVMAIERNRLEVVLLSSVPSFADVSILPAPKGSDSDLDKIANNLVTSAQNIFVTVNGYGYVRVRNASILPDVHHPGTKPHGQPRDYTAVYVCVPILILAVFVSVLVVMHYKKKFMEFRRYALLRDRNAADNLLEVDDDDPPLDPNPDFPIPDDVDGDENLVGQGPALVMFSGGEQSPGGNQPV